MQPAVNSNWPGSAWAFAASAPAPDHPGMKRKADRAVSYSAFYEQAAEGGNVAFVPSLPVCHRHGDTLEEAESNLEVALAWYPESLIAHGGSIPEEKEPFQGRVSGAISVPA